MALGDVDLYYKNIYGVMRLYPASKTAEAFVAVKGGKTLGEEEVEHIRTAGFSVNILEE